MPYNRRDEATLGPRNVQRMRRGGTIVMDAWAVYPGAAKAAGVEHLIVNHSEEFKGSEGQHTNNVEG